MHIGTFAYRVTLPTIALGLAVGGCGPGLGSGTGTGTAEPTAVNTPTVPAVTFPAGNDGRVGTATAPPDTVASAVPGQEHVATLVGTDVIWSTEDTAIRDRYPVIDVAGRKVEYLPDPTDVEKWGHMQFTWDAPPSVVAHDQVFKLHYAGTMLVPPTWNSGTTIDLNWSPVTWLRAEPEYGNGTKFFVGMGGDGVRYEGWRDVTATVLSAPEPGDFWLYYVIGELTVGYWYQWN
jgi:hypothetical protein